MTRVQDILPGLPDTILHDGNARTIDSLIDAGTHYMGTWHDPATGRYQLTVFEVPTAAKPSPCAFGYIISPSCDNERELIEAAWSRYGLVIDGE